MAKIKKQLRDDPEPDPWYPPNYDYVYQMNPRLTKKMWRDMDPNLKTGLKNARILNYDVMGRYGLWEDWEKIPKEDREYWGIHKYGPSYTNPWKIWSQYVGFANMPWWGHIKGKELMDPSERNKIYGIDNWSFWYTDPITKEEKLWRGNILPTGSPISDPWGIAPPWLVRNNEYGLEGYTIHYIDWAHDRYETATAHVPNVCRTIKSKRV